MFNELCKYIRSRTVIKHRMNEIFAFFYWMFTFKWFAGIAWRVSKYGEKCILNAAKNERMSCTENVSTTKIHWTNERIVQISLDRKEMHVLWKAFKHDIFNIKKAIPRLLFHQRNPLMRYSTTINNEIERGENAWLFYFPPSEVEKWVNVHRLCFYFVLSNKKILVSFAKC